MSTLNYTVVKAQSQQGGRGSTAVGTAEPQSEAHSLGTGALFLISESGREEGAQLLASRPDYMGFAMQARTEWMRMAHLGHRS